MSNNIVVGYSPNDFFYVQAEKSNTMPSDSDCELLTGNVIISSEWDSICENNFSDNIDNCLKRELCTNKNKATQLQDLENTKLGALEKYMNEKMNYDSILMNTINLGIGIVVLLIVIYKNQK